MYFHDRTSYLAATSAWKVAYRQLSAKLRTLKHQFKQAQRDGAVALVEDLRQTIDLNKHKAISMIAERHQAKQEAQRQWLAQREQVQA